MWNDSLHVLYRFNDSRLPWVPIYSYTIILWHWDGDLLCEREIYTIHRPWLSRGDRWYPSCNLLGTCLRNIFHSIFTWLYKCVKIWRILVDRQFRQILAAPKFPSIREPTRAYCSVNVSIIHIVQPISSASGVFTPLHLYTLLYLL